MLKIPANWSEVDTSIAEPKKMPAGGYICRIVKAFESVNKYNEPCLTLYLDVDEGEYKNYFGEIYKRRLERGVDRYPCVYNQRTDKFAARHFKRLIRLLEYSNPKFEFGAVEGDDWDEREIERLRIGVVFREKEFRRGDSVRSNLVPCMLRTLDQIRGGGFIVPEKQSVEGRDNG